MRVCHITSVPLPPEEGIGNYVWNLTCQLTRKGHYIEIITRGRLGGVSLDYINNIRIWRPTFITAYPFHVYIHGIFVNKLISHLEHQFDIFHAHTPLPPVVRTIHPVLLTLHTLMQADVRSIPLQDVYSLLIKLQLPISYCLERQLLNAAAKVTAVAHSVANESRDYGVNPDSISVLGNGVDHELFSPNNVFHSDKLIVLAAGRLGLRKGLEDLIACARLVCQESGKVQFWIAGEGPLKKRLKYAIKKSGLDNQVFLLGHVAKREEMVKLYNQSTIFVHSAHYEGLPTVILEAMSCGKPVVATAVSGALDVIVHGENGLLVPARRPEVMAQTVLTLLRDSDLRLFLGQNARTTIEQKFSWDIVSDKYIECYEKVLRDQ